MYALNEPTQDLINKWVQAGINTAFISKEVAADKEFKEATQQAGISTYIISPIFFNPERLAADSSLYAITNKGNIAKHDWVEFVCPSNEQYKKEIIGNAVKTVKELNPDGLSIDFIRHFVFWEMVGPEKTFGELEEACFCDNCTHRFQDETSVIVPTEFLNSQTETANWIRSHARNEWTEWKSALITSMVADLTAAVKEIKPDCKFNLHAVPWRKSDYGQAIDHIAGQNFVELSKHVDYISPMCYTFMLYRSPEWINSVVTDIKEQGIENVVPCIQVMESYRDDPFPIAEYEQCITQAIQAPSDGIAFWSWEYLQKAPTKMESTIKKLKIYKDSN